MTRYHFNSHDGGDHRDVEGTELSDHKQARAEALKSVGQILIEEADHLEDQFTMEVTDDKGLDLYHLNVGVTPSPAVKSMDQPSRERTSKTDRR